MNKRSTQLNKDNRGVTLVELIVALLVLMIAVTPLLMTFVNAMKSNRKANNESYARIVAENAMEEAKYRWSDMRDVETSIIGMGAIENYSYLPTDGLWHSNLPISQGTGQYKVTIEFDRSVKYNDDATKLFNKYEYADMSELNKSTTALINPVATGTDYTYIARDYFQTLNEAYVDQLHETAYTNMYNEYLELCEPYYEYLTLLGQAERGEIAYEDLPDPAPVDPGSFDASTVPTYASKRLGAGGVEDRLTQTLRISLVQIADGSVTMNAAIVFKFNNRKEADGIRLIGADEDDVELSFMGFCDDVQFEDLRTLYIMYDPVANITETSHGQGKYNFGTSFGRYVENIEIESSLEQKLDGTGHEIPLDVYIAVQGRIDMDLPQAITGTLGVTTKNLAINKPTVRFFSQADLSFSGDLTGTGQQFRADEDSKLTLQKRDMNTIIDTVGKADEVICNVTVKVYDYSAADGAEPLYTMESAIFESKGGTEEE